MKKIIYKLLEISDTDSKPLYAMTLKLMEEAGELGEAVNHKLGNLPHKTMKEPLEGEIADVIIVALSILVKANPAATYDELICVLKTQLKTKLAKWEDVISHNGGIV
jgi:NTP pyrophosphatase (non-canonical NTP hydrolase)